MHSEPTMPIKTGRYFITNVKFRNQAVLPNSNSAEPVQTRYKEDQIGEQWDVIDRKNGHHGIKNVGYSTQYAASGSRSQAGDQVIGWERDQTWLIQKTKAAGQYTISTTDSKRFWGVPDVEQGTPIALAEVYTDPRNWWTFTDVKTGQDAEINPLLDNGRTAYDTATGEMVLQVMLFEIALPPVSPAQPFELDLFIIQEMPNELIQTAVDAANKICRPLINSGKLNPSNLRIHITEFECFENKEARQRFSGVQNFDALRNWRSWDYPWLWRPAPGVMTASLRDDLPQFRSSATKVVLLNVKSIPIRSGQGKLWKLLTDLADNNVILILTLSQPHLPDTLFDTLFFRELARLSSGLILNLPADKGRFYPCIIDYLQNFDADSITTKFSDVEEVKPELPLSQRKNLTLESFIEQGYAEDPEKNYDSDRMSDDDPDDECAEENQEEEDEEQEQPRVPSGTYFPGGDSDFGPSVPIPDFNF